MLPVEANLAFFDQFFQRLAHRSGLIGRITVVVELVEVNVVGIQAAQRVLTGAPDALRRGVCPDDLAGLFVKDGVEFGGDDHLGSATRQSPPQNPLAVAGTVDVGRVKEIDAQVQGRVNGADGLVIIHLAPAQGRLTSPERAADGPAPQPQGAHFNA